MEAVTITQITAPELEALIGNSIKKYLSVYQPTPPPQPETDRWFNLNELCNYLPDKPTKATVYGQVSANTIPYHKGAKKLRFLKSEIDKFLLQGKKRTVVEMQAEADNFLSTKKPRNHGK